MMVNYRSNSNKQTKKTSKIISDTQNGISFPIYESWYRGNQEEDFLTSEELVSGTDRFMRQYGKLLERGEAPDNIFFLDKSARPLAYMFRKLFTEYYPDTEIPQIRYINIGGSGDKKLSTHLRPFNGDPDIVRKTYGRHLSQDRKILVVDEYSHTGEALQNATEVFSKAFPQAELSSAIAYDKLPNWYQNSNYLGVEEYSKYDYEQMALGRLNKEMDTRYKNKMEMINDGTRSSEVSTRFWEIYNQLEGTIPYVKRGDHILTTYEHPETSDGRRLESIEKKENVFRKTRSELDRICATIRSRRI